MKKVVVSAFLIITGMFLYHQFAKSKELVVVPAEMLERTYYSEFVEISEEIEDYEMDPMETGADNSCFYHDINMAELNLMALVVEAEAANQGLYGKQLVVDVILNRIESEDFPNTAAEVLMQKNAFSTVWDGAIDRAVVSDETLVAIDTELQCRKNTEILYFTSEGFSKYGKAYEKIVDHYFSTKK